MQAVANVLLFVLLAGFLLSEFGLWTLLAAGGLWLLVQLANGR